MAYVLQGNKDCAIVSIANYTGKDYAEVRQVAEYFGYRPGSGTSTHTIGLILAKLTGKMPIESCPRRGQEKINGLVSWHRPNTKNGHLTACIDGNIFDTDGRIYTVKQYRYYYRMSIRRVWTI